MDKRGRWRDKKESYRDRSRFAQGNKWIMSSDDDKRVDDAMLVEEDRQQQQSPDDAPSTKLVCGEDTTERALTKALKINIGNSIRTAIAKLIVKIEIVKYVEKFNIINGKLPSNKFRNLLVDINIKIIDIREFINKRQYKNMTDYVNETASDANASENTKDYIISALIDALNGTDDLINFFKQPSLEERETEDNAFFPVMLMQDFIGTTSAGESEDKIKKLRSLRITGEVPVPIRDRNILELMQFPY
ncbi:hypothetical protein O3P69_007882 [Scylla paramamosain]|uniref:Uncharacterized protein n=1 Tax=Scylla paramamosain TaxID=85552 RepID=A0AAW0SJ67_SCYPA